MCLDICDWFENLSIAMWVVYGRFALYIMQVLCKLIELLEQLNLVLSDNL